METLGEKDLPFCPVWIFYLRKEQPIGLLPEFHILVGWNYVSTIIFYLNQRYSASDTSSLKCI